MESAKRGATQKMYEDEFDWREVCLVLVLLSSFFLFSFFFFEIFVPLFGPLLEFFFKILNP